MCLIFANIWAHFLVKNLFPCLERLYLYPKSKRIRCSKPVLFRLRCDFDEPTLPVVEAKKSVFYLQNIENKCDLDNYPWIGECN